MALVLRFAVTRCSTCGPVIITATDLTQGRNHRGGRVPRAPYHVPPTSK